MTDRYELAERKSFQQNVPLIVQDSAPIVLPNVARRCTDVICAVLFGLFMAAFLGLLIYGIVTGDYLKVVSIHNTAQTQCNQNPDYYYGYITNLSSMTNAVCVRTCPTSANIPSQCLSDGLSTSPCVAGVFTPSYPSFAVDSYCVPNNATNINIESLFSGDAYEAWVYDMDTAWIVLLCSAGAAIILSLMFFIFVRMCASFIIWLSVVIAIGGMITVGVFFILTAKGVVVDDYVYDHLDGLSYNTLIIVGSAILVAAFLLFLMVLCLHSRLSMGTKAVQLGSIFLFDNCCMVFLPITQVFFIIATITALIFGAGYLYSEGAITFPGNAAFPSISLNGGQIAMIVVFFAACLWMIFFFHGCNHYLLCSAVAIWYFNGTNGYETAPCGESLHRLVRFNLGSVAITSLINGVFFIIKIIANILSFDNTDNDNGLVECCLKCLNALFCIFKVCLRFLSDGAYVQMAITGQGYCSSTGRAFDLITDNAVRVGITDGISIFFTIIGILAVTAAVSVASYFSVLKITYYEQRLSSPFSVTFVSGLIAFVVASVYLSMIDISATSVLQCFLTDRERGRGKVCFASERLRTVMLE